MNTDPIITQSNAKLLKEIAYDMKVLFVEDEIEIQEQLKHFFARFFGRVDTADNGVEALDLYNLHSYDLVITDLTMPFMDGIELSANIRSIKESQHIIVVSAHSESEKLIELINIGVDGFILKPVDIQRVIQMLLKTCQSIYDHKMLHYFNNLLEQTNTELKESNMELERTLNQLGRLREECIITMDEKIDESEFSNVALSGSSLEDFYTQNDLQELERVNDDLEQIEDDFNLLLVSMDRNTTANIIITFNQLLRSYAHEVHLLAQCHSLGYALMQISRQIDTIPMKRLDEFADIIPMITGLFDHLEQWRRGIFVYQNVDSVHFLDEYLLKKITEIENAITD